MTKAPASHDAWLDEATREFLLELVSTAAPSGYEDPAAQLWRGWCERFAAVTTDRVGNSYATVNGGAPRRIALVGHIDEIGLVVSKVDDNGMLRFAEIGGWDAVIPAGQRVTVLAEGGPIPGTVGRTAVHLLDKEDTERGLKLKDLWVDIGATDADAARELVRPGDPMVLDTRPHIYDSGRLLSRSLDNRIGAFVAAEVARRCEGADVEVVAVATVNEENSMQGARTSAHTLQPDVAIVLDVTPSSDVPGNHAHEMRLGCGPAISFGAAASPRVARSLVAVAQQQQIEVQLEAAGSYTGTDADEMTSAGAGVVCGVVGVPCRYLHSPGEMLDLGDVGETIELLSAWVRSGAPLA